LAKQTAKQVPQNLHAWHVETCIQRVIHDTNRLLNRRPHDCEASETKEITHTAFPKDDTADLAPPSQRCRRGEKSPREMEVERLACLRGI